MTLISQNIGTQSPAVSRNTLIKMRSLLNSAQLGQPTPATAQPLIAPGAWVTGTTYVRGMSVTNGGNVYAANVGGVSGATGPLATTNGALVDGTVTWYYMGPSFTSSASAPTFTAPASPLGGSSVYWTGNNNTQTHSTVARNRDTTNFFISGGGGVVSDTVQGFQTPLTGLTMQVSFMTDAATFQVVANGTTPNAQFYVNGVPLTLAYGSGTVGGGSYTFWNFVFPTRAPRLITYEVLSGLFFSGVITLDATSKVWAPSFANSFRMAIVGSSYISGTATSPVSQSLSWGALTAKLLNCIDYWQDGQGGGTGYILGVNFGNPARFNLMVASNPDVVMVAGGGINDRNVPGITVAIEQAAICTYLAQVRAALPNAIIFVIGCEGGGLGPSANLFTMELAANQAVAAFNDPLCVFIPQCSTSAEKAWMSGTGTTAATNGTGNSDIYIGPDAIHPVQAGCLYFAQLSANGIINALNNIIPL
jgi:hypothetical protein